MTEWRCAFCDKADGKRTREHILRKKFHDLIPEEDGTGRISTTDYPHDASRETKLRGLPHSNFEMQVNEICEDCNRGWLNDLETRVEEIVVDLAHGRVRGLTGDEVHDLRFWMAKTALVKTLQEREQPRLVPLFREMYEKQQTPKNVDVQFAVCSGTAPNGFGRMMWACPAPAGRKDITRFTQTMVNFGVGRLFFIVSLPMSLLPARFGRIALKAIRDNTAGWNFLPAGRKKSLAVKHIFVDPKIAYINGSIMRDVGGAGLDAYGTKTKFELDYNLAFQIPPDFDPEVDDLSDINWSETESVMWPKGEPSPLGPKFDDLVETTFRPPLAD